MATLPSTDLIAQLNWRYAVKQFDPTRTLTSAQWDTLAQSLILSPSSYGLEPWKFINVVNKDVRTRLQAAAYGQSKVTEASHFLVLCIVKDFGQAGVDSYITRTSEIRKVPAAALDGYKKAIVGDLVTGPRHAIINEWSARQLYIALGTLLTSAAVLGIDACPMEGFDIGQFDQILGLSAKGLTARVSCALGFRSATDDYATKAKVRFPRSDVIEVIA
jgi:nitroreductase